MTETAGRDQILQKLLSLLEECQVSFLSSVRPDGRPHSVPIWHVLERGRIYHAAASSSVKVRNILGNPHVAVSARLDDPLAALIIEGQARLAPEKRADISKLFEAKYDWNIAGDADYDALIEVIPTRLVAWGQYGEGKWSGEAIARLTAI